MMIFLTDGHTYIGPYDSDADPFGIMRGTRTLRENHGASNVYRVQADTREEAIRKYGIDAGKVVAAQER